MILDFSSNVNFLGPPPSVLEAIRQTLWRIKLYPDPDYRELRSKIAERYGTSMDEVVVCNGASEAIRYLSLLCLSLGGKALVPVPTFCEYESSLSELDVPTEFAYLGPEFDASMIEIGDGRIRMVILCNPNNPTGTLTNLRMVESIAEECERIGALLVVDESFMPFTRRPEEHTALNLMTSHKNVLVVISLTKFYAIPGLRIGFCIGDKEIVSRLERLMPVWRINCMAEVAAMSALEDVNFERVSREVIARERELLLEGLAKIPNLKIYPSSANFLLIRCTSAELSGEDIVRDLLQRRILVKSCDGLRGLERGYMRVAVRSREENGILISALREVCGCDREK